MEMNKKEIQHEDTELRLGLPGTDFKSQINNKRSFSDIKEESTSNDNDKSGNKTAAPPPKAQVMGWPPVRNYRKNCLQAMKKEAEIGAYVKVSMDGAPYLRKIDMKVYKGYPELLKALEDMFKVKVGEYTEREGYNGTEYVPTYEDKDGDWMLVGDVPWDMFTNSCKRLRIMKGSDAKGLGCLA
ncbi:Auxin-induced protein 22D [Bienertia sinuspersici]